MHPDPHAEFAQLGGQISQVSAYLLLLKLRGAVTDIHAIRAGVLRDDDQFLGAARHQPISLVQYRPGVAADLLAAQLGNDAKRAGVVAPFGDFEVGEVARRQLDAGREHVAVTGIFTDRARTRCGAGQQIGEGMLGHRQQLAHMLHHVVHRLRTRDGGDFGVAFADLLGPLTQATRHDDFSGGVQRFANRREAFLHGGRDKAAGVDNHGVGLIVTVGDLVALHPQLGQDALGIHQRFGATQADKTDFILLSWSGEVISSGVCSVKDGHARFSFAAAQLT